MSPADLNWPDWRQDRAPAPVDEAAPPEYAPADATREQQLNDQYLAGRRQILNTGEGAYYRLQGEAAIHGARPALEALQQLKDETLAQAGNDRQRSASGWTGTRTRPPTALPVISMTRCKSGRAQWRTTK